MQSSTAANGQARANGLLPEVELFRRNPADRRAFSPGMQQMRYLREADEAALEAYASARERGDAPGRALNMAILCWLARCDCADGREARARVVETLLRTRTMGPRDYDDWVILASGGEVWDAGAHAAIHQLSIDCRALEGADTMAGRQEEFEQAAADELSDYLRSELPRKVRRLRRLARELLPAGASHDDAYNAADPEHPLP